MVETRRTLADAASEALCGAAGEERLPFGHAAALIVALSLGVWAVIGIGLRLLIG